MPTNFDQYISTHFGHISNAAESKHRINSLRANYSRVLPANLDASLLEIGPGRGEFLELLIVELGYRRVTAIDVSTEVVQLLSARYPGVVLATDIMAFLRANPGGFEAVFMMHVLEHLPKTEAIAFLAAVRQVLAPGGSLVIEVPNMANPLVGLTFRYADFTHETGFTRSSLEQVLRMAGFETISVKPFAIPGGSIARWVQRIARMLIEGVVSLVGLLYFTRREIVSPNIVAIARSRRDL